MSKVTAINIIIKKKNQLRKHKEGYVSYINIDDVLVWLNDIQKEFKPTRYGDRYWMMNPICNDSVSLPKGTIKKLIGRELSWSDEPVELKEE